MLTGAVGSYGNKNLNCPKFGEKAFDPINTVIAAHCQIYLFFKQVEGYHRQTVMRSAGVVTIARRRQFDIRIRKTCQRSRHRGIVQHGFVDRRHFWRRRLAEQIQRDVGDTFVQNGALLPEQIAHIYAAEGRHGNVSTQWTEMAPPSRCGFAHWMRNIVWE